jgi:methylase of polypeptide subunit release factors
MSEIVEKAQEIILSCKHKGIAVDATCGNGHDTLFLLKHFKQVYAFDIQPLAIKRTAERTKGFINLILIENDFQKINKYVDNVDAIMFNLGFLPGSNKRVKTSDFNSAAAILKAYDLLNPGAIMSIACYTKHDGGMEEFQEIKNSLKNSGIPYKLYQGFINEEVLIEIIKY